MSTIDEYLKDEDEEVFELLDRTWTREQLLDLGDTIDRLLYP